MASNLEDIKNEQVDLVSNLHTFLSFIDFL